MPKKLENLREIILEQAKGLLMEAGFKAFTMRQVAKKSGIAVGTLYNYFPSKEDLVVNVIQEDWKKEAEELKQECAAAESLEEGLRILCQRLNAFALLYRQIWGKDHFQGRNNLEYIGRHSSLVRQIADFITPVLEKENETLPQMRIFLAENILLCAGKSELQFSSFLEIVKRIKVDEKA